MNKKKKNSSFTHLIDYYLSNRFNNSLKKIFDENIIPSNEEYFKLIEEGKLTLDSDFLIEQGNFRKSKKSYQ